MNLLFLCPYLPVQGMHAGGGRMFSLIREHAKHHSVSVISFVTEEDRGHVGSLAGHCAAVVPVMRYHRTVARTPSLTPYVIRQQYDCHEMNAAITAFTAAHKVDLVTVEYMLMAQYLPPGYRSVLVIHELMSLAAARAGRHATGLKKLPSLFTILKTMVYEDRVFRKYDYLVTLTERERRLIRLFYPYAGVELAPMGADGRVFSPMYGAPEEHDLIFVGNFWHHPNVDAIHFFCREIFPLVQRELPATRLTVVGYKSLEVLGDLGKWRNVTVTGLVPDLKSHLARSRVFINPIRLGSGMRGKLLEAMAMGLPIVSTSIGADGIDAEPGREMLIADRPDEFAAAVVGLLRSKEMRARVGGSGRALFKRRYDWRMIAETMERLYEKLAHDGGGAGRSRPVRRGRRRGA